VRRKIRKFKGGGADMGAPERAQERADRGYGSTSPVDRTAVGTGSKFVKNKSKQVTVKSGPNYVNTRPLGLLTPISYQIGATILNFAKKSMYNKKNLKDQKKVDVLGGEMLTRGKTGPKPVRDGNQSNPSIKPTIPTSAIATTKPVDTNLIKPTDNFFNFVAYRVGGLSGGVSYGPPPKRGPNPQVPPVKMKRGGHK